MKIKIFLFCLFVISTKIFKLDFLTGIQLKLMYYPLLIFMLVKIINKGSFFYKRLSFKFPILAMFSCILLSSIPCYIYYNQNIPDSLVASFNFAFPFLIYFYLHASKVPESDLLKVFLAMSLLTVSIQIFQQFYPEYAIFGVSEDKTEEEFAMRNNLYRYRINFSGIYTFPILFYLWFKIMKKYTLKNVFLIVLFLTSIYLALTRQVLATTAICLLISVLLYSKHMKKSLLFIYIVLFGVIIAYNFDSLFSSLVEKSINEINNEDYIRYKSFEYFSVESRATPLHALLGHGIPRGGSSYDDFINMLAETYHYYSSDVGFVGAAYKYGYIYVILFYLVQFVCLWKYRKYTPSYIAITMIGMIIYSIMLFMINQPIGAMVWASMLYIIDLHKYKSPLRLNYNLTNVTNTKKS